ncbi:hypothetical protein CHS0354_035559 [Potamilus streckersoni]|uniref:TRIM56 n=1 Tax=Potamilus streckersoni TaxID=2493646 RepID=A0AAE0VJA5_9BIVA|nr:hypothetical protein CHS0354_035559 [Potamilus streckersoni]
MSMMATGKIYPDDEQNCPICLGHFNQPRQLPCAHTFCQSCLQSFITTEATKDKKLSCIKCPVCRQIAGPAKRDKPTSEWASLYPANTVLQSILPSKSKVDRLCDACHSEDVSVQAEGFCAICKEAMCGDCIKYHRKQKQLKNHPVVRIEELTGNMENVMKWAEGFTCTEHNGEDIKIYCRDHKFACCAICFLHNHKTCSQVIDLKEELSTLLHEIKSEDIIHELTKVKTHLIKFMEINDSNIIDLESQVNGLTDQIADMRKKINSVLDDLEKKVKMEGSRIYKEESIRKQEENHQCLALLHSVRNSHFLFETVLKYGSDVQKFLMTEKIKSQLRPYYSQIKESFETTNTTTVMLEFAPLVESILLLSSSEVGMILSKTASNTLPILSLKPTKDCQVERLDIIDIEVPGGYEPFYTGITFLPIGNLMLVDCNNKQCILLSPSYQFLACYKLTGNPADICVIDREEVALTIPSQNKIQILSVRNDTISHVSLMTTIHWCYGIADAGKGKIFVTGNCGNGKCHLSLITMSGDVLSSFQYDDSNGNWNYIASDCAKTRVYITMQGRDSVFCFNMDGTKHFTYSSRNLRKPFGISVDRDDNIFVLGYISNCIHQISPDGSLLQLIRNGVPYNPRAICFSKQRDLFLVTNESERRKLYVYQMI